MSERFEALVMEKDKDKFFSTLAEYPNGLELEIKNINGPYSSNFVDEESGKYKKHIVVTFSYSIDDMIYETRIRYNLGVSDDNEYFTLKNTMMIFKLLHFFVNNELEGKVVVKAGINDVINVLKGQVFKGILGYNYNNPYVIPTEKIMNFNNEDL